MVEPIADWIRPHFEQPSGRPFLFYVVYGRFPAIPEIDSQKYRTRGIHPGLELSLYDRARHADVFTGFEAGYLWNELVAQDPALASKVSASDQCLILFGEIDDRRDLNYL